MAFELNEPRDTARSGELKLAAGCCLARGERQEAARLLAQAAAADPLDDDAWLLAAFLLHELGQPAEAVAAVLRALTLRPYHPRALNLLGVACLDAGRPALARRAFDRAQALAPALESVRRNRRQARGASKPGRRDEPQDALAQGVKSALSADLTALSAVIVARDGPSDLDRTLGSLDGLAAQTVVLDAPSADDESAGWNAGLAAATGGWILLIEAGETIDRGQRDAWVRRLGGVGHIAHPVAVRHAASAGAPAPIGSALRLLRNVPGLRLRGRAHACPVRSLDEHRRSWGLRWGEPGLSLDHPRPAPDARTLLARVRHDADFDASSATALAYRSWHLVALGDARQALEALRAGRGTLDRSGTRLAEPEQERLLTVEAYCLMRLDRASETIGVLESAGLPEPRPANLLFLEGAATLAAGRGDRAATLLASALERAGEVSHFDALPERLGAGLPNLLGTALLERQDLDGAERAFRLAVDRHPTGVEARLGLIGVSLARRLPEQALQELDRLAAECGHRVQAWLAGAQVLSGLSGLAETWVAWLEEALRRFPEHPALVERLAAACLCSGRTAQALALWERVGPRADLAGRFTACLAARRELPEAPVARHAELTAGVLDWCRRLWRQEAWGTLDAVLLGLDRAIARVPGLREPTAEWLERAGQAEAAARVRGL